MSAQLYAVLMSAWFPVALYSVGAGVCVIWMALRLLRFYEVQADPPLRVLAVKNVFLGLALAGSAVVVGEHPVYDRDLLLPWVRLSWAGFVLCKLIAAHLEGRLLYEIRRRRRQIMQSPEVKDLSGWAAHVRDGGSPHDYKGE